jgi:hypothetical protein
VKEAKHMPFSLLKAVKSTGGDEQVCKDIQALIHEGVGWRSPCRAYRNPDVA